MKKLIESDILIISPPVFFWQAVSIVLAACSEHLDTLRESAGRQDYSETDFDDAVSILDRYLNDVAASGIVAGKSQVI